MKILITGAIGFLGAHLYNKVRQENHEVIGISKSGSQKNKIYKLDLTDFPAVKSFINTTKPDVVYHLAAHVNLSRDFETANRCISENITATLNLLESLKDNPSSTFIFASTEDIYGSSKVPYKEDVVVSPQSPYAISKYTCEQLCQFYTSQYGITSIILRIGTVYGPNQPTKRFIAQVIAKAIIGDEISLNSGQKKRDYIYIDDVIDAFMKAKEVSIKKKLLLLNIGGGKSYTLKEFVEKIRSLCDNHSTINLGVLPERKTEVAEWLMDIGKACKCLGWTPATKLSEGLEKTIKSFKDKTNE